MKTGLDVTRELIKSMARSTVEETNKTCIDDIRLAREYLEGMRYATLLYDSNADDGTFEVIQLCITCLERKEYDIIRGKK